MSLPENSQPLNQSALIHLRRTDYAITPLYLYVLQLMDWGLNHSNQIQLVPHYGHLREHLEALLYQHDQSRVFAFLQPEDPDEETVNPKELADAETPADAALMLLEDLHMTLLEKLDGYGRGV